MMNHQQTIRATFASLGGLFFFGALFLLGALLIDAWYAFAFHPALAIVLSAAFMAVALYVGDGFTEKLAYDQDALTFDSWLRRKKNLRLAEVKRIVFVHEGLNLEHGIETMRLVSSHGREQRFALGPFWHRHKVMGLLNEIAREKKITLEERP